MKSLFGDDEPEVKKPAAKPAPVEVQPPAEWTWRDDLQQLVNIVETLRGQALTNPKDRQEIAAEVRRQLMLLEKLG